MEEGREEEREEGREDGREEGILTTAPHHSSKTMCHTVLGVMNLVLLVGNRASSTCRLT